MSNNIVIKKVLTTRYFSVILEIRNNERLILIIFVT